MDGGQSGKDTKLGKHIQQRTSCEDLKPGLRELLIEHFEVQPRHEGYYISPELQADTAPY
ncbi:hypothetical protein IFO70_12930 [Phormidium tenue FACHB-886]|nr:hypothetical protein [Phormidium tenue FACHB-886]